MSHDKVLIIGAGVAGPVAALALQRAGIEATVYEAYPNTAHGVGAYLGVAPNGIAALDAVGLRERVQDLGVRTPRMALWNGAGRRLVEVANGLTLPDGTTNVTIRRANLYQALHEEAIRRGVRIEHGKRLVDVADTGDGLLARFADGSEAAGGVLIGADGMRSRVRALVDPNAPRPEYLRMLGTGGYAHGVTVPAEPGTFNFVFGRRGFFAYLVADDGTVWWFANEPWAQEPTNAELAATSTEDVKRRLIELFAGDAIPVERVLRATDEMVQPITMHSMAAPRRWHRGRMVLVGDAAHVTSPSSGQGASLAIEDAVVLARCLRDVPDVGQAFATYQALREDRVRKIYLNARRVNQGKAAGPVGRVIRDLLLPVLTKKIAKPEANQWLYAYRVDFDRAIGRDTARAA